MLLEAEFWVAVGFFAFVGVLVYFLRAPLMGTAQTPG